MAMWKRSKRPRSGPLLPDISLACIQGITLERDSSACTDTDLVEEQTCRLLREAQTRTPTSRSFCADAILSFLPCGNKVELLVPPADRAKPHVLELVALS